MIGHLLRNLELAVVTQKFSDVGGAAVMAANFGLEVAA
jgi:hypothetical protein